MKIAILTIGSEGDIRPYIALGQELQQQQSRSSESGGNGGSNHEVYLVTHANSKERIENAGLHFADIGKDPVTDLQESELGKAVNDASTFGKLSAVKIWFASLVEDWFQKGHDALTSIQPDFVVLGTFPMNIHSMLLCSNDVLKIPYCQIHLMPILPTTSHAPPVGFGDARPSSLRCLTKLKWNLSMSVGFNMLYKVPLQKCYAKYGGVSTISNEKVMKQWRTTPAILGYSDILSPRPYDYDNETIKIVGPLMDNESEDSINSFLSTTKDGQTLTKYFDKVAAASSSTSGGDPKSKPTIFVGFGSMWDVLTDSEKQTLLTEIVGCAKLLENETSGFIVQCDEATFEKVLEGGRVVVPDNNFITIQSAPHSWLFPKVDIVVCHGGSGTTHKAILHNCATIVCPCKPDDSDQPFWAGCVARAGLGIHGPNATTKSLRKSKLVKCIRQILNNPNIKTKVQTASELMKKQDGIKNGAKAILEFASRNNV